MRLRRRWRRAVLLGLALAVTAAGTVVTAGILGSDPQATVLAVREGVSVREPGRSAHAVSGMTAVGTGAWVETRLGSRVAIAFPDGSRTVLDSSSRLKVTSLTWLPDRSLAVVLLLERGQAWTVVAPGTTSFRFEGGGRGSFVDGAATAYSVAVSGTSTVFELYRGTVVVHSGPGAAVWQLAEGGAFSSSTKGTTAPEPIPGSVVDDRFLAQRLQELAMPSSILNRR